MPFPTPRANIASILPKTWLFDVNFLRNSIIVINFSDQISTLGERFMFQTQGLEKDGRMFHSPKHLEGLYYSPRSTGTKKTYESGASGVCDKQTEKGKASPKEGNVTSQKREKYTPHGQENYGMIHQPNGSSKQKISNPNPNCKPSFLPQKNQAKPERQDHSTTQKEKIAHEDRKPRQNIYIASQYYQSTGNCKQRIRRQEIQKWKSSQKDFQSTCKKIEEVTFSLESTEPQNDDKQLKNDYNFPEPKEARPFRQYQKTKNQAVNSFRKKIIEKEIEQKQKIYRSFIRSSSKQRNQHQKARLKSKMKEVMDQIYELKRLIRP